MYKNTLILISAMFGVAGCQADAYHLELRSTLDAAASSAVLSEDGSTGRGSMNEQVCQFDSAAAQVIDDDDLPTAEERVEDIRGGVVIARSAQGVHVIGNSGWDPSQDLALSGVEHVRMTLDGIAVLSEDGAGCHLDWRDRDTVQDSLSLDASVCANATGFTVDPVSGQVWIGHGGGITSALPGAASELPIAANLLAFDEVTGNVFAATRGQDVVTAFDASGNVAWTENVRGTVHDLTDMGAMGATAVINDNGGTADINIFDGASGEQLADFGLPGVADIVVSADASTIGLLTETEVHFYDVMEGSAPLAVNDVQIEPPPMFHE